MRDPLCQAIPASRSSSRVGELESAGQRLDETDQSAHAGGQRRTALRWGARLDRQDLFFFGGDDLVDALTRFGDGLFGLLLGAVDLVFARIAALFELVQHV
jgi:hypothetical protein